MYTWIQHYLRILCIHCRHLRYCEFTNSCDFHNGTPLQYSRLESPMDGGAWWAAVHGVAKSRTRLSNFTFTFHFHALEKEMETHSSVLAWRIPGTGEPGGLPSMGRHRVGHDWSDLAAAWFSQSPARFIWSLSFANLRLLSTMFTSMKDAVKRWSALVCLAASHQVVDTVNIASGIFPWMWNFVDFYSGTVLRKRIFQFPAWRRLNLGVLNTTKSGRQKSLGVSLFYDADRMSSSSFQHHISPSSVLGVPSRALWFSNLLEVGDSRNFPTDFCDFYFDFLKLSTILG